MKKRPLFATAVIAALTLAACGDSDVVSTGTWNDCPETISLQTDWYPEAEHGNLYQLIGPGYTVDKAKLRVTGDLIVGGEKTDVKIEIRAGGPAIGSPVVSQLYQDPSILLGFRSTDDQVSHTGDEFPTIAVVAPFNINPQMIMWDPDTYPNVKTIADLKETGAKVRYFQTVDYMDYFTATGILDIKQVDATYDGKPASFVAAGGKDAQQGFGTSEPHFYKYDLKEWMKEVRYQYIHDAGWTGYAQSLGGTPENIAKYDTCLKALVPAIQQATVDYLASPDTANAVILDAVRQYNTDWAYTADQAQAAVTKMQADKLIANSPDGTLGSFDIGRVTQFIAKAIPVYKKTGTKIKEGLVAGDIVTNKYIDPTIKLG